MAVCQLRVETLVCYFFCWRFEVTSGLVRVGGSEPKVPPMLPTQ